MAQLIFLESAMFADKNGCVHEIEDLLGLRPRGLLTELLEKKNRNHEGARKDKHENDEDAGVEKQRNDKGNKDDMYPNLESTKLWDVLSLLYDVGRDLSVEEHELYVKVKFAQAKKVFRRRVNLRKMFDMVMNTQDMES